MNKNIIKTFRINEKEQNFINKQCDSSEHKINESEYIRSLIRKDMSLPSKESFVLEKKKLYEINKIGVNINQIARDVNSGNFSDYEKKKLFALMNKLLSIV